MDIFSCPEPEFDFSARYLESFIGQEGLFYKGTGHDYCPEYGIDPRPVYKPGGTFVAEDLDRVPHCCSNTVIHASPTPNMVLSYYDNFSHSKQGHRLLVIKGVPVCGGYVKLGFRSIEVVRELPPWRVYGQNGQQVVRYEKLLLNNVPLTELQKRIIDIQPHNRFSKQRYRQLQKVEMRLSIEGYERHVGMAFQFPDYDGITLLLAARPILNPEFIEETLQEGWGISLAQLDTALQQRERRKPAA